MNLDKLVTLRARHAALRAEYQREADASQEHAMLAVRLRTRARAYVSHRGEGQIPRFQAFTRRGDRIEARERSARERVFVALELTGAELAALPPAEYAPVPPVLIAEIAAADVAAQRSADRCKDVAAQTRESRALLDRLEAYAKGARHGEADA